MDERIYRCVIRYDAATAPHPNGGLCYFARTMAGIALAALGRKA